MLIVNVKRVFVTVWMVDAGDGVWWMNDDGRYDRQSQLRL